MIKEQATNQKVILAMNETINSNTTTYSSIIDTADYDNGLYFVYTLSVVTTAGTAVFSIQEGEESNMSDAEDVVAAKLVYGDVVSIDAAGAGGGVLAKEALFSNKRYVRVKVITTNIDTSVKAFVAAVVNPETLPTLQSA